MIVEPLHPQDVEAARSLYLDAFPEYERADWDALVNNSGWGDAELLGIYDDGLEGISYVIFDETFLFVLYLAIEPSRRGTGVGSGALRIIESMYSHGRTFLNVEPTDEVCDNPEQRLRRVAFYEHCGYSAAWKLVIDENERYTVMCKGVPITPDEMESFRVRHGFSRLFGHQGERSDVVSISHTVSARSRPGPGTCPRLCPRCR